MDENTVELNDGGCMEWDDDGTIRYRDQWGNCENIWRPEDEEYEPVKNDWFPNHTAIVDEWEEIDD